MSLTSTLGDAPSGLSHNELKDYIKQHFSFEALTAPLVPCIYHTSGCKKTFDIQEELEEHVLRNLTTDKDHEWCEECNVGFTNIKAIRHHYVVSQKHEHVCPVCAKEFKSSGGLLKHIKQDYAKRKELTCLACHEVFYGANGAAIQDLLKHIMVAGACKAKQNSDDGNQAVNVMNLTDESGKAQWPVLPTPRTETPASNEDLTNKHNSQRVNTLRIVDKAIKPKRVTQTAQSVSHESGDKVEPKINVDVPATNSQSAFSRPNDWEQERKSEHKTDETTEEQPTAVMPNIASVPVAAPTNTINLPSSGLQPTAPRPFSYAGAVKKSIPPAVLPGATQSHELPGFTKNSDIPSSHPAADLSTTSHIEQSAGVALEYAQPSTRRTSAWPRNSKRRDQSKSWSSRDYNSLPPASPQLYCAAYDFRDPQIAQWLDAIVMTDYSEQDFHEDVEHINTAKSTDDESLPPSRPRTPDDLDYDIVLNEHMYGRWVGNGGNRNTKKGVQKLDDELQRRNHWCNSLEPIVNDINHDDGPIPADQPSHQLSFNALAKLNKEVIDMQFPDWHREVDQNAMQWDIKLDEKSPGEVRSWDAVPEEAQAWGSWRVEETLPSWGKTNKENVAPLVQQPASSTDKRPTNHNGFWGKTRRRNSKAWNGDRQEQIHNWGKIQDARRIQHG